MSELDVLVVGAGISGLALAHNLARAGLAVEVWESDNRVGGKIRTLSREGYRLDNAATMVMNFRGEVDGFLDSAGLTSKRCDRSPNNHRYLLHAGELQRAPVSIGGLFKSPLLSTAGKLRMLAEPLVARGRDPHESVAEFVSRRIGREFVDKIFEPYLAGPLASDVGRAEARAAMPRLTALERRYGSLALGALLCRISRRGGAARPRAFSFTGGMETLVRTLAGRGGAALRTGAAVVELWPQRGGWRVRAEGAGPARNTFCRQIVLCNPAYSAARLLNSLDPDLSHLLAGIDYAPVSVVHTGFERGRIGHALDGSGFLLPQASGYAVNGCLWISSLFPDRAPADRVLLTSYLGGARNPAAADWNRRRSLDAVMPMLRDLLDARDDPEMLQLTRHRRALPLYHENYSHRLAAIDSRLRTLPGLYLAANYIGGVSVRDRILHAGAMARRVLQRHRSLTDSAARVDHSEIPAKVAIAAAVR